MKQKMLFSPSLMCMDIYKLREQIDFMNLKADLFHVDITDSYYVKNFALYPLFVSEIRKQAKIPIDCHLMMRNPHDYIKTLADYGADYISPHSDIISKDAFRFIEMVKHLKCKAGIVINPADSLDEIKYYMHLLDKVTIMTVDAGVPGQKFIPQMADKIYELKCIRARNGFDFLIEADGSCNEKTFKTLYDAGTDVMVVGTSGLFGKHSDIKKAWEIMMNYFDSAISMGDIDAITG